MAPARRVAGPSCPRRRGGLSRTCSWGTHSTVDDLGQVTGATGPARVRAPNGGPGRPTGRSGGADLPVKGHGGGHAVAGLGPAHDPALGPLDLVPVSYTHLTLPTIY